MKMDFREMMSDRSVWPIIASNILTIVIALYQGWNIIIPMLIYWFQSATIGFFNFLRMLTLKDFSVEGLHSHGKTPPANRTTKITLALFFALHYGGFHMVYLFFLLGGALFYLREVISSLPYVLLLFAMFFMSHLFSFIQNNKRESRGQNIGKMMLYPYVRIIPMHLTLVFGGLLMNHSATILFLLLKTVADVVMHGIEHSTLRKAGA